MAIPTRSPSKNAAKIASPTPTRGLSPALVAQLMVKLLLTENGLPLNAGTWTPRKRAADAGARRRSLEWRAGDRGRLRAAARREDDDDAARSHRTVALLARLDCGRRRRELGLRLAHVEGHIGRRRRRGGRRGGRCGVGRSRRGRTGGRWRDGDRRRRDGCRCGCRGGGGSGGAAPRIRSRPRSLRAPRPRRWRWRPRSPRAQRTARCLLLRAALALALSASVPLPCMRSIVAPTAPTMTNAPAPSARKMSALLFRAARRPPHLRRRTVLIDRRRP